MGLKLEQDDLIVITLKDVASGGNRRYFDIHKYNKETNQMIKINSDVSEITGFKQSNSDKVNIHGSLMVNGVGQNMTCVLMERLYKNNDLNNGIDSGNVDYYNKSKQVLNIANKDNKQDKLLYETVVSNGKHLSFDELKEITPIDLRKPILSDYLKKEGLDSDKEFFLNKPDNFAYANKSLKDDKDFAAQIIQKNSQAFEHVSDRLKDDKDFILNNAKGGYLSYVSDRLKDDKEVVLNSVKRVGYSLEYASDRLKDDKDIVLVAVKKDDFSINYASERIQKNCQDKDPIRVLESEIFAEQLQSQLANKQNQSPTKKLKI